MSIKTSLILLVTMVAMAELDHSGNSEELKKFWDQEFQNLSREKSKGYRDYIYEQALDTNALIFKYDTHPVDIVLRRTGLLLQSLKSTMSQSVVNDFSQKLESLKIQVRQADDSQKRDLFDQVCALRRLLAFKNPLLDMDTILFVAHGKYFEWDQSHGKYSGSHICDQYFGFNAGPGGGIFLLINPFSETPELKNLLQNSVVQSGRLKGQALEGGSFLSPELSYDGKTVYFSYVEKPTEIGTKKAKYQWRNENTYHLFRVNIDGSGLEQLTDGNWNEFDPHPLPNGRIVYISEKRGGYGRCHGRPVPTYTLYSMKPDGSDIYRLSHHETNEWHPSVNNEGMIVYSRWDYVDRDAVIAHHLWTCFPDGRNPRSYHGNYPLPLTTWNRGSQSGMNLRANSELNVRAIPGSHRYIATAAPHHALGHGSLLMIDLRIEDDNKMSQAKRITPMTLMPESDGGLTVQDYGTAWPLSEDFYLCNYMEDIILLDRFGNRITLLTKLQVPGMQDDDIHRLIDPMPVRRRTPPPRISGSTNAGEDYDAGKPMATIKIQNVYESDMPFPEGVKIKWLRIVQLLPNATENGGTPKTGYGSQSLARMPLGVVPVEEDGSVYLEAPVNRAIYFQVLDENGRAVQSMRSATYVQPGEQMSCVGCHENKWKTPSPMNGIPLAFQRPPSKLQPEVSQGAIPYNWHLLVKPVIKDHCINCHDEKSVTPDLSYKSLKSFAFFYEGRNGNLKKKIVGGSRSMPGKLGAIAAPLTRILEDGHYNTELSDEEMRRITIWLDMNSNEFGVYTGQMKKEQASGKIVWPELDVDSLNPTGVELGRPVPPTPVMMDAKFSEQNSCGNAKRIQKVFTPEGILLHFGDFKANGQKTFQFSNQNDNELITK